MIEFRWGTATDVGRVRQANQDQLLTAAPMFVVADGMGGHAGGEVASAIAIDEMAKAERLGSVDQLVDAIQQANREIVDRSRLDPELRGMGTTLVALVGMTVGDDPRLGVANVGDSRVYRRADDELVQVTEDHTLVEALVRDGRLTPEEALDHPQRNIVTRALGIDERVLVDSWELTPVVGDRYLLCSDGLFNELDSPGILEVLHRVDDAAEAAVALVSAACEAGGRDNVTVVIVDVVDTDAAADNVAEDRIIAVHKALPDGVLRLDPPTATGPSDPHPDEIEVDRTVEKPPFVTWRLALFVAAVLIILGVVLALVITDARSSYFVGLDGEEVVIYRGQPDGWLWIDPTIEEREGFDISDLNDADIEFVADRVEFDSFEEARDRADGLIQRAITDEP
jgi:serine/threonine protein phosphatase PrpC